MQVVRDDFRLQIEQPLEMFAAFLERTQRLQVFQIADVMADEHVVFARQAEGVFQFRATGQNPPGKAPRGFDRLRRVTARTAQQH